ncbi:5,6-dimethylbenzimidazole synthase [Pleionea litopenaei]|uniref:5,6-dimethylbenzimidazole synthase n=1 Tax=Pleionea litopenaei TaxID=3070815 RepID=A0AA51X683_9GAMM|nr:5,6-dimethylbenzimidazole synthase [Pleionea sp. HL-JVS1]WMS87022.1 5,6-dimethylbenzimidazole synthase [Pleionea sp. HL-JVS1]
MFFNQSHSELLEEIMRLRRDVRGHLFTSEPVSEEEIEQLLYCATLAPSVGFSQPWSFVVVRDLDTRKKIHASFSIENNKAASKFTGDKQAKYQQLKLEGILEAPVNLAVFYQPSKFPVLGQTSMDKMGEYSVVCAIQNMWLMARSMNLGMGWVSILDPDVVKQALAVPIDFQLIGYLCIGYVKEFYSKPELERKNWAARKSAEQIIHYERFKGG